MISLVVAAARNGVIGRDGGLPWHLGDDLRFFKALTMGKPLIMGRKTFESIGRPLPGRRNIVLTRREDFEAAGCEVVAAVEDALAAAGAVEEIMVIGGGEIYRLFLPLAERVYLTRVETEVEGDTRFPPLEPDEWEALSSECFAAGERNDYPFTVITYERRRR